MDLLFPLLILALLVPMFLGIRRQKREAAKTTALQDSLTVGDRIVTTAGLHATVAALADETVELEIAPGIVTTWARQVVRERIEDTVEEQEREIDDESIDAEESGPEVQDVPENPANGEDTTPRLNKD